MVSEDVLFHREGPLGRITLNRPKALNALTYDMCAQMLAQLRIWADDPAVQAVVVDATPGRAFCAGGDIRAIHDMGKRRDGSAEAFFTTEYRLNATIEHYSKPYLALIDGIVMGGGVGISIHGAYRAISENAVFAMPETAIGLYPDVGGTYALPRLPGEIGMYLALTGARIGPADMIYAKVATHFIPAAKFVLVLERLGRGENPNDVLSSLTEDSGPAPLAQYRAAVDRAFAAPSVEGVLGALEQEGEWGNETAALLRTRSPTSLKLTFRALRDGRKLDFDTCMRVEYRLTMRTLEGHDLYEGVRAAIIDKDQQPQWQPAAIEDVSDAAITRYFAPFIGGELTLPSGKG
jgi:enoyl-CoA hydratase/carnithine racemase